jgi:hypothetical protein
MYWLLLYVSQLTIFIAGPPALAFILSVDTFCITRYETSSAGGRYAPAVYDARRANVIQPSTTGYSTGGTVFCSVYGNVKSLTD